MPTPTKTKKTTGKKQQELNFADRVTAKDQWQQYNSEAPFHAGNIEESLETLAGKTFPTDAANRNAYQEAIVKSLTETLSPEIGIKDFWGKMAEANCLTLRIEEGHLNFYDKRKKRIDITSYTQPIVFVAHSSYYNQKELERQQKIEEAKKQLQELLEQINKNS